MTNDKFQENTQGKLFCQAYTLISWYTPPYCIVMEKGTLPLHTHTMSCFLKWQVIQPYPKLLIITMNIYLTLLSLTFPFPTSPGVPCKQPVVYSGSVVVGSSKRGIQFQSVSVVFYSLVKIHLLVAAHTSFIVNLCYQQLPENNIVLALIDLHTRISFTYYYHHEETAEENSSHASSGFSNTRNTWQFPTYFLEFHASTVTEV